MILFTLIWSSDSMRFTTQNLQSKFESTSDQIYTLLKHLFLEKRKDYLKRSYKNNEVEYEKTLLKIIKNVSQTYASIIILAREKEQITIESFESLKKSTAILLDLIYPIELCLYETKHNSNHLSSVYIWRSFYSIIIFLIFKKHNLSVTIKVDFKQKGTDCDAIHITENKD